MELRLRSSLKILDPNFTTVTSLVFSRFAQIQVSQCLIKVSFTISSIHHHLILAMGAQPPTFLSQLNSGSISWLKSISLAPSSLGVWPVYGGWLSGNKNVRECFTIFVALECSRICAFDTGRWRLVKTPIDVGIPKCFSLCCLLTSK